MKCAICLRDERDTDAITIADGHALCGIHFAQTLRQVNNSGGSVAARLFGDTRFRA